MNSDPMGSYIPESSVTQTMQRDLFPPEEGETVEQTASLFADIVFDRPLDHAFTYAVGDALRGRIAVGKRIARRSAAATRRPSATACASARRRRNDRSRNSSACSTTSRC